MTRALPAAVVQLAERKVADVEAVAVQQLLQLAGGAPVFGVERVDGPVPHPFAGTVAVAPGRLNPPAAGVQHSLHTPSFARRLRWSRTVGEDH